MLCCGACAPRPQWRVFTDMGRELVQQGRHGEAERYFKRVRLPLLRLVNVGWQRKGWPGAAAGRGLACRGSSAGRTQASGPAPRLQALECAREGFGADDPHMASACNNLAEFYRLRRQYEAAEPLYRQVPGWAGGRVGGFE